MRITVLLVIAASLGCAADWPAVPDPLGLGPRLALIDLLHESYHLAVPAGIIDDELIALYTRAKSAAAAGQGTGVAGLTIGAVQAQQGEPVAQRRPYRVTVALRSQRTVAMRVRLRLAALDAQGRQIDTRVVVAAVPAAGSADAVAADWMIPALLVPTIAGWSVATVEEVH